MAGYIHRGNNRVAAIYIYPYLNADGLTVKGTFERRNVRYAACPCYVCCKRIGHTVKYHVSFYCSVTVHNVELDGTGRTYDHTFVYTLAAVVVSDYGFRCSSTCSALVRWSSVIFLFRAGNK